MIEIRLRQADLVDTFCQPLLVSPYYLPWAYSSHPLLTGQSCIQRNAISSPLLAYRLLTLGIIHGRILTPGRLIPFATQNVSVVSLGVSRELETHLNGHPSQL